ncbi:PREDICTED: uncharacterized protein LOC108975973 [Bactrocera latifrons]|uniref:uncharacterized protein LOC108975973 n=1 Tax=Bactrocera latifrons TaxID=174628 RepID=UPI0008DCB0AC|nr:PREDICTED: uncharacterized protein LOC108975973 [Bactrocera latifrons]
MCHRPHHTLLHRSSSRGAHRPPNHRGRVFRLPPADSVIHQRSVTSLRRIRHEASSDFSNGTVKSFHLPIRSIPRKKKPSRQKITWKKPKRQRRIRNKNQAERTFGVGETVLIESNKRQGNKLTPL